MPMPPGWSTLDPPFAHDGMQYPVYHRGTGPAVIVMHELFGLAPECIELGERLARDGFMVFMPLFFGEPGQDPGSVRGGVGAVRVCMRREFNCMARDESSPVTRWLRGLCGVVSARTGGQGIGAIGLCLTGGFVLQMMIEPSVRAPVACEPALPLVRLGDAGKRALGIDPDELRQAKARHANDGVPLMTVRYATDPICPAERIGRIREEFPGVQHVGLSATTHKHATLTKDFSQEAYEAVRDFLRANLQPGGALRASRA